MTVAYMSGHVQDLISRIGAVDNAVAANLTDRFRGSWEHLVVLAVRAGTTVALWGMAGFGAWRRIARGDRDLTWAFLAIAPFALFFLQSYGGEILLRIYLFSLPFMALLAASALGWRVGPRWRGVTAVAVVSALLVGSFFVSRYGNERMDVATAAEADGMEALYEIAPHGSLLVALTDNAFWKFEDYELYHYRVAIEAARTGDVGAVVELMQSFPESDAYLVVSRAQFASLGLQYGISQAEAEQLVRRIEATPEVAPVFANTDVRIFKLDQETTT
jgi:hypothetical protein